MQDGVSAGGDTQPSGQIALKCPVLGYEQDHGGTTKRLESANH